MEQEKKKRETGARGVCPKSKCVWACVGHVDCQVRLTYAIKRREREGGGVGESKGWQETETEEKVTGTFKDFFFFSFLSFSFDANEGKYG
ncbi:hypothetical protein TRSC58_07393 [Trypanosoma rangeli SC58]|uniref:Uncharacterized protein n=1 Tax=Trypanosoma rangeli SC58 TaxID=429131 RepID=A0A061ITB6_TRYRA|nr:hypothetical protein TRSC58_07393 [Trypanosoma rangeli SC58]